MPDLTKLSTDELLAILCHIGRFRIDHHYFQETFTICVEMFDISVGDKTLHESLLKTFRHEDIKARLTDSPTYRAFLEREDGRSQ